MTSKTETTQTLIWRIRRLFQLLSTQSNLLLSEHGINVSQRAIMEFLSRSVPQTLSDLAREHHVSRQHIQQTFNELQAKKLVKTLENPKHKRSFLVCLSPAGETVFHKIQTQERLLYKQIAQQFNSDQLEQSSNTLDQLQTYLQSPAWNNLLNNIQGKSL
ncbi:MAG: MarR family winged helix-turn-helix transcriptional regulator [Gammaproteobacteria bacterium]|nr:MarR family winged helix-turn-helix transcriptional regulator [Gammaproteobacteria bacterium]MDH5731686.1 MarR family winged helix-turn-helix transcriptional regulator [Gammaproteobacteria bacterium]